MSMIRSWLLCVGMPLLVSAVMYYILCLYAEVPITQLLPVFVIWQICWLIGFTGLWWQAKVRKDDI